ncbi:MAG: hypothetical protein FWH19_03770 [Treponema sp.]|nr:hypothetical protein [Treponema sp.]
MAKKDKAVYAPGELDRVRERLGSFNPEEARQLAEKLGGEVGYERSADDQKNRSGSSGRTGRGDAKSGGRAGRRIDLAPDADGEGDADGRSVKKGFFARKGLNPLDDPTVPLKSSYLDRIKMDRFCGQSEFEIKTPMQVFQSIISPFMDITDFVSPVFVTRRMPEYYKKIEVLVVSTRNLFPRNNLRRNEILKKGSPMVYLILDTIRSWDIEKMSGDLAKIQAKPKSAKVGDFVEILRAVYKPLFILSQMDPDAHIRSAFKILYKMLYIENPMNAQAKYQELIRSALASYFVVKRDIHYLMYPLLMKTVSARFVPYANFFAERKNRIMAFLGVTEENRLTPLEIDVQAEIDEQAQSDAAAAGAEENKETVEEKELTEEEKAVLEAEEAEKKVMDLGIRTLEMLFPKAGWDRLSSYPDFYPYFVEIFDLKKGMVNIAPTDPMLQIYILMRILEELFFGLRYVRFGSIHNYSGNIERVDTVLTDIVNNWRYYLEASFEKEYLGRLAEYVRILEGSMGERSSPYTRKLVTELHWVKRLFLLPYYKFDSLAPPTLQKKETVPIYSKVKALRKYLGAVASGIDNGIKAGGAEAHAPCEGIENPWDPYVFQVPNPLSIRLDALLSQKQRNNATLIYFCLAVTTVLDKVLNADDSWAYSNRPGPLFRSVNGEGVLPLTGVDERVDANSLFKQSLKERQKKAAE